MAIDELLRALDREAQAEAAQLLATARADAAASERAATERVAHQQRVALAETEVARQLAADAAVAAIARRRRKDVLTRRAAALDRVHAAVTSALPDLLAGDGGAEVLAALVAGVTAALAGGGPDLRVAAEPVEVRCPPALVERVGRALGPRPGLRVIADPAVSAGLIAVRDGGRVTIDARLATCLDRWWPHLRVDVRAPDKAS